MPSGAVDPQGEAVTPDGRFLFVSHRGDPDDLDVVTRFAVRADGTLTPLGRPARIGKSGGDGSLRPVPGSPFAAPDFPIGAAVTPNGKWLYVADGGTVDSGFRQISAFAVQPDGRLRRISEFTAGQSPTALTVTPDGHRLYASNLTSDDVSGYDIGATGKLTGIPGSPFSLDGGEQPAQEAITITPDQGPTADFTSAPGRPGGATRFDSTASADPDGRIARFDWDFGDGTIRRDGGPRPAHVYTSPGTFTVTLTVTDNEGCSTHLVYTGTSVSCNGSAAAAATRTISVER
jgi:DNA-binding beta-propeller fold protein YncE